MSGKALFSYFSISFGERWQGEGEIPGHDPGGRRCVQRRECVQHGGKGARAHTLALHT